MEEEYTLRVPCIPGQGDARHVGDTMDEAGVPWLGIDCQPWAEAYPYKPRAHFRIAHSGRHIMLDFRVEEEVATALAAEDGGRVWEDSCCEFFIQLDDNEPYYNIECNCIGRMVIACGRGRDKRTSAPKSVFGEVRRWSSLGAEPFPLRTLDEPWRLSLVIPTAAFFLHHPASFHNRLARVNFYKCGDLLPQPHYLSWRHIQLPEPDFHSPKFFGTALFERPAATFLDNY